jgi:Hint module
LKSNAVLPVSGCFFGAGKAAVYFGTVVNEAKKVAGIDGEFGFQASLTFVAKDPSRVTSPSLCFPGDATCQVEDRGHVAMKDIKLGDKVLVQGGKYEAVYSFGHRAKDTEGHYLKFVTTTGHVLEISEAHMVFVEGGRCVPASSVRIGDKVELADDGLAIIQSIKVVLRQGAFAPFTASGTVIVNGVKASSFIAFQNSESLKIGGIDTGITFQFLGHAYESPQRLWCQYLSSCTDEQYSTKGIPLRLEYVHHAVRWYFDTNLPAFLAVAMAVPVVALIAMLAYPMVVGGTLVLLSFAFFMRPTFRTKAVAA